MAAICHGGHSQKTIFATELKTMSKQLEQALAALSEATSALELVATPRRPDGTYNRSREACEELAAKALEKVRHLMNGERVQATQAQLEVQQPRELDPALPIVVFSDGACKGNPGPAAWGVAVLQDGQLMSSQGGFIGRATNQVAELMAAIEGLKRTPAGASVELVSDSQYVLKGLTEWRSGWLARGWKNGKGEPVANQSYWVTLYALADARKVKTRWVKGHSGDRYNELCDELANQAIARAGEI